MPSSYNISYGMYIHSSIYTHIDIYIHLHSLPNLQRHGQIFVSFGFILNVNTSLNYSARTRRQLRTHCVYSRQVILRTFYSRTLPFVVFGIAPARILTKLCQTTTLSFATVSTVPTIIRFFNTECKCWSDRWTMAGGSR